MFFAFVYDRLTDRAFARSPWARITPRSGWFGDLLEDRTVHDPGVSVCGIFPMALEKPRIAPKITPDAMNHEMLELRRRHAKSGWWLVRSPPGDGTTFT